MELDLYQRKGLGDDSTALITPDVLGATVSQFNWEDWALVGLGVLVFFEMVGRGARGVGSGTKKKSQKVSRGFKKRKRALKTVFTGS